MSAPLPGPQRLFCSRPFLWFEVQTFPELGDVYLCCPSWLPKPVGNLARQTVDEVWNGPAAKEIRESILDGSFRYCDATLCPFLQTRSHPVETIADVRDPRLRAVIDRNLTEVPFGPAVVNCCHDRSCNLACPTCRVSIIIEREHKREILEIQGKIESDALRDAEMLYITGSGDPFGSPFFREWLQTMRREHVPGLQLIHLHTNAQMWTERIWGGIDAGIRSIIRSAEISIDAARPETYAVNRAPGRFDRLLENLDFIRRLRRDGPLQFLALNMVVQANNYREMPEFVVLGERFGADRVIFSQLTNWGTFTDDEFRARAVHLPTHPNHLEFRAMLHATSQQDSRVFIGNLSSAAPVAT